MPSLLDTLRRRSVRLAALVTLTAGAVTAASAGPAKAAGAFQLRVATYNLQAGAGQDGRFDLNRTAAAIRALNADVVGLQEVDVHWGARSRHRNMAGELARKLGMRVCFAPIYSHAPTRAGG